MEKQAEANPNPDPTASGNTPVTPEPGSGDGDGSGEWGEVPAWAWWAGAAAVVLMLAFGISTYYGEDGDPKAAPLGAKLGDVWERPSDGMQMLFVPPGSFAMGNERGDSDERPVHTVTLDGFWIDETEVTNAQYGRCVQAGECAASQAADNTAYNGQDYPVVAVTWQDADAFCSWAGGQLPSNAQWEYAARGPDGNGYPWGDGEPTCDLAQYNACDGDSVPVGSFPDGASWVGAMDMAGNAWEWVNDWYGDDYYANSPANNPEGPATGDHKVLRGGGWRDFPLYIHGSHRAFELPDLTAGSFGFRCISPGG